MNGLNVSTDRTTVARAEAAAAARDEAEQWLDALLAMDRERRVHMATVAVSRSADIDRGRQCWIGNHDERITESAARRDAIREALEDLRKNGIPEMSEAGQSAAKAVAARLAQAAGLSY